MPENEDLTGGGVAQGIEIDISHFERVAKRYGQSEHLLRQSHGFDGSSTVETLGVREMGTELQQRDDSCCWAKCDVVCPV